ncbi:hypothetical protein [Haloprofundus halobius]|uniref:hypothetical protein n=1 Tax=Haloprofundus halobius TaxID=2876194 RepID=UPI001CC9ACC8|nr:hypothetical protein [Haloprofundus halobius]
MDIDPIASGRDAVDRVEKGDRVVYKNDGQPRRKQPLTVSRTTRRTSRSGRERKELELNGSQGGCYLMTFSLSNDDVFADALHVNLNDATTFHPEEFHLMESG